ncbi:MAG: gfo/Idh/MocA family oxidoreductase, partial [Phycisphaerae bacterium]
VWMVGQPAVRVASFGMLTHFRSDSLGPEIPERCTDGCPIEPTCPYSAIRLYLGEQTGWPVSTISLDRSLEARRRAVESGPYGRCVYRCGNDVVDHQVVAIEFAGQVTVGMTMQGHAHENTRTMRYSGTEGEIRGHAEKRELIVYHFGSRRVERIETGLAAGGHGGGDPRLCEAFAEAVRRDDPSAVLASAEAGLEGHLLCFAAEQARRQGMVVEMERFRAQVDAEADAVEQGR